MRELESDLRRVQLSPVSEPRPPAPLSSFSLSASLAGSAPPGAFTATSETLDEASLLGEEPLDDDDDDPIAVPKRRPVWLWAVAAGILVMIALSLSVRSREGEATPGHEAGAASGAQARTSAAGAAAVTEELPQGLSAPELPRAAAAPRRGSARQVGARSTKTTHAANGGSASRQCGATQEQRKEAPGRGQVRGRARHPARSLALIQLPPLGERTNVNC